jgi:tRNA U34 2-thiouridine synthase MnmA/TrmU
MENISKQMYLLALQVVSLYESNLENQYSPDNPKNPIVKKNDVIVFTKLGHLNKALKLGKKYIVSGSYISAENSDDLSEFYGIKNYKDIRRDSKAMYEFMKDNNIKMKVTSLRLDTGLKNKYDLYLTPPYEYYKID